MTRPLPANIALNPDLTSVGNTWATGSSLLLSGLTGVVNLVESVEMEYTDAASATQTLTYKSEDIVRDAANGTLSVTNGSGSVINNCSKVTFHMKHGLASFTKP